MAEDEKLLPEVDDLMEAMVRTFLGSVGIDDADTHSSLSELRGAPSAAGHGNDTIQVCFERYLLRMITSTVSARRG